MASIQHLDNPLLLLIFNRLSIEELFPVGHVCVRWNAMRTISAHYRKDLVLLIGNEAKRYIDESVLQIPERRLLVGDNGSALFPENDQNVQLQISTSPLDFVRMLPTHFTNLTTLTIGSRVKEDLRSISHLLEQFNRPNGPLHTLKLYSNRDDPGMALNTNQNLSCARLLSAVNSIGSLKKLIFDVNAEFVRVYDSPNIDLPILAQLEEFEFNSLDYAACLYNSILQYAVDNQKLRSIRIKFSTYKISWLLALPTKLSSRFTHLNLCVYFDNEDRFEQLCRHFVHLTSLIIKLSRDDFTIFSLLRPLTHLPNLLSLVCKIFSDTLWYSTVAPNERGIVHFELPSVKVFTFKLLDSVDSHNFFHECNMNRIFPNVQVVRVLRKYALCCECEKKMDATTDQPEVEEHCARHMFRHFTHSQHLRMVSAEIWSHKGTQNRQWFWNEMEPFEQEEDEEVDRDK